jgi:hypothetical protein
MLKSSSAFLFTALLCVGISGSAWATGEEPPPLTPCVDLEKTCQDARFPEDPISYEVALTNCGEVMLYCNVEDLITHEILINGPVPPGETVEASSSYTPDQCGESTNEVKARCSYQISPGVLGRVYDRDDATCSVPCGDDGCTLTPGYWKTHSNYGPAPYDPTWAMIGEDTPFFLSGISYYEALWTEPKGGNAYFILAHAYIAAELNLLNGASIPADVEAALDNATSLLNLYTPEFIGELKGKDALRKAFVRMAKILDDYNNGISGPGHCVDEDDGGDE